MPTVARSFFPPRTAAAGRPSPVDLLTWAPCVIFCLVNAVFFAAAFNYVNFRYAVFSHAFFLVLVFRPAIRAVLDVEKAPREGLA